MPPHWWIPVRGSDPKVRKREIKEKVERRGAALQSVWKARGSSQLYAIVRVDALDDELSREIGKNGDPIELEDV